ncbi:helix-turn-helix domain-containing protein [Massilia glaciei]|uniref:AraC family transcriptional regulator n=1 Tax=Massilia glaciei TaxID=1524097 RepID=A0A2U2HIB4_9BURK|nr:helix-turn-helix domain-containing protein [Massilia glaciei]PWF46038.1 AraC family transcriptional regulator [Massilia glaciei]
MSWTGKLEFGSSWVAFRGRAADNTTHAHAALQLTLSADGQVTIRGATGTFSGPALLVAPGAPHAIHATGIITLLLIEPQSPIACLLAGPTLQGIALLPASLFDLVDLDAPLASCIERLLGKVPTPTPVLDARLAAALQCLALDTSAAAVARAAGAVGLSTSRLRALATQELGIPLAGWVMWRKLERAGRSLSGGASLAEAAFEAGFADQAHFTRTMRKVLGITPRMLSLLSR